MAECLIIVGVVLGFLYAKCGVFFETVDDRVINDIFAGVITGRPDPYAIYVNYLLGALLSFLYTITKQIAWYGLFLILCHYFSYVCILAVILNRCKSLWEHICGLVVGIMVMAFNLFLFGQIQYTSTAALVAMTGYFLLIWDDSGKRKYILFGIFEILAVLLRDESMLMIQPIGFLVYAAFVWAAGRGGKERMSVLLKKCVVAMGIVVTTLLVSYMGNYIIGAYNSPEWKEFSHFRQLRGDLQDYFGYPSYEEVEDILERYDVTQNEYHSFARYWILGNALETECLEEVYEYASTKYWNNTAPDAAQVMERLLKSRLQGGIAGYGKYTLMLYAVVGAFLLFRKKWEYLLPVAMLNISRNAVMAYLIVRGRMPFRVLAGLYFAEIIILAGCLWGLLIGIRNIHKILRVCSVAIVVVFVWISSDTVKEVYQSLYWTNRNMATFCESFAELQEYCAEDEKGYVCATIVLTYYTGEALNTSWHRASNVISSGLWYSMNPRRQQYEQEFIDKYQNGLVLIEMSPEMDVTKSYVHDMLTQERGLTLHRRKDLVLSTGTVLSVYDIEGFYELNYKNKGAVAKW